MNLKMKVVNWIAAILVIGTLVYGSVCLYEADKKRAAALKGIQSFETEMFKLKHVSDVNAYFVNEINLCREAVSLDVKECLPHIMSSALRKGFEESKIEDVVRSINELNNQYLEPHRRKRSQQGHIFP